MCMCFNSVYNSATSIESGDLNMYICVHGLEYSVFISLLDLLQLLLLGSESENGFYVCMWMLVVSCPGGISIYDCCDQVSYPMENPSDFGLSRLSW